MLVEVLLQHVAFMGAELVAEVDGALEVGTDDAPFVVGNLAVGGTVPDVRHGGEVAVEIVDRGADFVGEPPQGGVTCP